MTPRIFGIPSSISPKPVKLESTKLAHSFTLAIPTGQSTIFLKGAWFRSRDPRKFDILRIISRKPIKLETSHLVRGFSVATSTIRKYNVPEKGRGLGHMTLRICGIPSSISPKPVKLESSKLAHSFALAIPTGPKYNISERGRGIGHVTLEHLTYSG